MRLIGRLKDEKNARTFGDYLTSLEIRNDVEAEADGSWAVWVYSEDQLEASQKALAAFSANPNDPTIQRASSKAASIVERQRRDDEKYAKRVLTRDTLWANFPIGPVTMLLMGVCILVSVISVLRPGASLGRFIPPLSLFISIQDQSFLPEVRDGQVWRLLTPVFIHMSPIHLFFNMYMLKDFGSLIEARMGAVKLLLMVLIIGVLSNLGQYIWNGPAFGGMSGVLYGMFGFVWMRGKFDIASGMRLMPADVMMLIGWYFLCVFNIIPYVANGAHTVGLVVGMIWGAAPPLAKKLLKL